MSRNRVFGSALVSYSRARCFHGDVTARMARFSLTAKVANDDDLVCAPSVSARDIRHTVWLYLRFTLSYRHVEDLLAERMSYESADDGY
jgi:hypothetical protein